MEAFRYHVYVCTQEKPEGVPCCTAQGSMKTLDVLRRELAAQGLQDEVQVTTCGSLGLCENGPNLMVYPEGAWYSGVRATDVAEIVRSHLKGGMVVQRLLRTDAGALRSEIQQNRDRYLASMKARDEAGQLPEELIQKLRAFQDSRILLTAIELNVFTAVGNGLPAGEVARKLQADARATEMLLNALVAMGLLLKSGEVFVNTAQSTRFFTDGSPDSARMAIMHHAYLWHRWSTLTECVRAGTAVARGKERELSENRTQAFIGAMHHIARERAPLLARAVPLNGVRRMLDLGGGSGAYSIALAQANPQLRAEILDRPEVTAIAQQNTRQAGVADRVSTRTGDMLEADFGHGYDLVLVSAICHMFSPAQNQALLKKAFAALENNGRVVISDFILNPDKTSPAFAALFSINMLVGTEGGASYSEAEYDEWLRGAGFAEVQRARLPGPAGLMIGTKRA